MRGGSVIGFAIVFVSFVFRSLIPAPTWVWLVVLAVGVLLAVKDGISGLDVITLALAGFMIVGSLTSIASTATDAPDLTLKEPIPAPAGYGFSLDDPAQDSTRTYRSKPIPVKTANQAVSEANQAVAEVVDYYIAGLPRNGRSSTGRKTWAMGIRSTRRQSSDRAIRPTASASRCMRTCWVGLPP